MGCGSREAVVCCNAEGRRVNSSTRFSYVVKRRACGRSQRLYAIVCANPRRKGIRFAVGFRNEHTILPALIVEPTANMSEISPNSLITEDGLVLKNVEKIEELCTRIERRLDLDTYSWQICRQIRRDFNIMTIKMFKFGVSDKVRQQYMHDLIMELALQAGEFEAQSKQFSEPAEFVVRKLPLRLVSAQSANLLNALRQADRAYARTNAAVHEFRLTFEGQHEMASGFLSVYGGLKHFLFGESAGKTADELGKEMGIA